MASIWTKLKNAWLSKHPETRILKDNGQRIQVCSYENGIAFCSGGAWYEVDELEAKA